MLISITISNYFILNRPITQFYISLHQYTSVLLLLLLLSFLFAGKFSVSTALKVSFGQDVQWTVFFIVDFLHFDILASISVSQHCQYVYVFSLYVTTLRLLPESGLRF